MQRWVILDVGETLIDETRVWSTWADQLGLPRLTFMAALGAEIAGGGQHHDVFARFGVSTWREWASSAEVAYAGFQPSDLYPDALRSMTALRDLGYRLAIIANQPAQRTAELRALGVEAEVMAMSAEMQLSKPDPAFFARALELLGSPPPGEVAYVGDRVENDLIPATEAGMRAVWIRRGPWGLIQQLPPGIVPALVVDSLDELVERIDEAWSERPNPG
ncbi:MAG TPA: HAD family hydrolase [Candidatus Limnocylindria bacterium]